jgi:hypothetical protein
MTFWELYVGRPKGEVQLTAENTTTSPNSGQRSAKAIFPVCCHRGLDDLQGLTQGRHFAAC